MDRWIISIQLPHLTKRLTVMDACLFHAAGQSRSRPPGLCVRDSSVTAACVRVTSERACLLCRRVNPSPFFWATRHDLDEIFCFRATRPFALRGGQGAAWKSVSCEGAQLGGCKAVERDTFFRRVALKVFRFKNHRRDLSQESSNARVRPSP